MDHLKRVFSLREGRRKGAWADAVDVIHCSTRCLFMVSKMINYVGYGSDPQ